jgi:hypothetical protein
MNAVNVLAALQINDRAVHADFFSLLFINTKAADEIAMTVLLTPNQGKYLVISRSQARCAWRKPTMFLSHVLVARNSL